MFYFFLWEGGGAGGSYRAGDGRVCQLYYAQTDYLRERRRMRVSCHDIDKSLTNMAP